MMIDASKIVPGDKVLFRLVSKHREIRRVLEVDVAAQAVVIRYGKQARYLLPLAKVHEVFYSGKRN